ncbi:hypothetical protein M3Y96_01182400 [Aphelenchoides besseyi]|nr:hypothetical protein M3Y96_01182400 [Aphelenchoides besseyi]
MNEPYLPVYELTLSSNENLISPTHVIPLAHEAAVKVRCSVQDSGFDGSSLYLTRNHQRNITQSRRGHSVMYTVESFDSNKGEEIFDCTAKRRDSKYHVRSLKFVRSRKPRLSNGASECETNHCRNGLCLKNPDGTAYCMCAQGFGGQNCEYPVYDKNIDSTEMRNRSIAIGAIVFFAFLAVIFLILFLREKRKNKQLKKTMRELRKHQNLNPLSDDDLDTRDGNEDLENLYDQADGHQPVIRRPTIINDYDNLKYEQSKCQDATKNNEKGQTSAVT